MSDPRNDPRAHDLLTADAGEVIYLAGTLRNVAQEAQHVSAGLEGARNDATWTGSAADAFRAGLGQLPQNLHKVTASYEEAANALDRYDSELSFAQPAFERIAGELDAAYAQLGHAQHALSSASSALQAAEAKAAHSHSHRAGASATYGLSAAVGAATGSVESAQTQIDRLCAQGFAVLDQFDAARRGAAGRLAEASAVPPHRSFWDTVFHDAGDVMGGVGHFVVGMAKGIATSFEALPGDVAAVWDDPTSLSKWGKLLEDGAVDLAVVAGAVAVILCPFDAPAIVEIGEVAETVGDVANASGSAIRGTEDIAEGHWADLAFDVAGCVVGGPKLSDAFGVGDKAVEAADDGLDEAKDGLGNALALRRYINALNGDLKPSEALAKLTEDQRALLVHNVKDLLDSNELNRVQVKLSMDAVKDLAKAQTAKTVAETAARRLGRPIDFAVDRVEGHAADIAQGWYRDLVGSGR